MEREDGEGARVRRPSGSDCGVATADDARQASGAAASASSAEEPPSVPRRFVGRRQGGGPAGAAASSNLAAAGAPLKRFIRQQVPDDILQDEALNQAISVLPTNYNFEIHKTIWRLRKAGARRVALQFPEGLLMFSCVIADILERFAGVEHCFIMGEVTFGACCVDDYSALALRTDFLIHYGHSCLVPVDVTGLPCLYVFVDIHVDVPHLLATIRHNFEAGTRLVLAGTIQFATAVQKAREVLAADYPSLLVPQAKPLSPGQKGPPSAHSRLLIQDDEFPLLEEGRGLQQLGRSLALLAIWPTWEVLGCTAPVLQVPADALVFIADGRFHLEAFMIANPSLPAFRYDPYGRVLTEEKYDHLGMREARRAAVEAAEAASHWGLLLGTLGRQGNPQLLSHLRDSLSRHAVPHTVVLMTEVTPAKLRLFEGIDAWVEVACPRLAIDWGEGFSKPTLTPYEALVALGEAPPWWDPDEGPATSASPEACALSAADCSCSGGPTSDSSVPSKKGGFAKPYPMDYYARDGGAWSSTYHRQPHKP